MLLQFLKIVVYKIIHERHFFNYLKEKKKFCVVDAMFAGSTS